MDEEKDLELEDSTELPDEDGDSKDTEGDGETPEDKIAKLEQANKELFARTKKAEEEAKTLKTKKEETPPETPDVDKLIAERFEERDLASLDVEDDIKAQVKAYARVEGISVLEASKSDYIGFLKTRAEEKARELEASAPTKKGGGKTAKRDFSKIAEVDGGISGLSDEEFDEYQAWLKKQE